LHAAVPGYKLNAVSEWFITSLLSPGDSGVDVTKIQRSVCITTENAGMENAGLENAGPNFTGVENAAPPSMEREMDKYKCIMYR